MSANEDSLIRAPDTDLVVGRFHTLADRNGVVSRRRTGADGDIVGVFAASVRIAANRNVVRIRTTRIGTSAERNVGPAVTFSPVPQACARWPSAMLLLR